jgi:hypothetical protein
MYTLHMSWSFRAVCLAVGLACGLAPQLACFMPSQPLTASEMDCCQEMSNDCSGANMSDACCQTVVRTDVGVAAKMIRNLLPPIGAAESGGALSATLPNDVLRDSSVRHNNHAPPPESAVSYAVLRI